MKAKENFDLKNVTKTKKAIVTLSVMIFLFWGIVAGAISVSKFENYIHPYLFGFSFGTIGLIVGIFVSKKIKKYIIISQKMITDYFNIILAISVGFIGTFMLLSQSINKSVSDLDKCDNYTIVAKQYREGGFRRAELNIIKVDIDGEIYSLLCKHQYWTTLSIGQTVDICIYKSHIGFDYIELKEDK